MPRSRFDLVETGSAREPNPTPAVYTTVTRFLATPAAFGTLAVALAGWLLAWSMAPIDGYAVLSMRDHTAHRPFYCLARGRLAISIENWRIRGCGVGPPKRQCIVYERDGEHFAEVVVFAEIHEHLEKATAAAVFEQTIRSRDFGLLAPVVFQHIGDIEFTRTVTGLPLPDHEPALKAAVASQIYQPPWIRTDVSYRAAAHDLLFLTTLAAFARSALAVPAWPIWKRITPAQRRRMRNACAACSYDRTGLAADAPCPECGRN